MNEVECWTVRVRETAISNTFTIKAFSKTGICILGICVS